MRADMPRLLVHTSRHGGPKNDDAMRVRRAKVRVNKITHLEMGEYDEDDDSYAVVEVPEWEEVSGDDPKVVTRGKVAMRQKGYGKNDSRKTFGENLQPLVRYMHKQVGRPWDKVYSEIRAVCEPTGTVNAHIYQHLGSMVIKDTFIGPDGKVWERGFGREAPISRGSGGWFQALYIHPTTGLLCRVPLIKAKRWSRADALKDIKDATIRTHKATGRIWLARTDSKTDHKDWFEVIQERVEGAWNMEAERVAERLHEKGFDKSIVVSASRLIQPYSSRFGAKFVPLKDISLKGPISLDAIEALQG